MSGGTSDAGISWRAYSDALARQAKVERKTVSISQFAELMGFEPSRFIGVQVNRQTGTLWIILEPEDADNRNDAPDSR